MESAQIAYTIDEAHRRGELLRTGRFPKLDSDEIAMDVASALHEIRQDQGLRSAGWKLGYTSEAMRQQMGISQPNASPVYVDWIATDSFVSRPLIHPRVEPEVCVSLAESVRWSVLRSLPSEAQTNYVLDRIDSAKCAMEVVDSVWTNYTFTWGENTADGSSAAGAVIGDEIPNLDELAALTVHLSVDEPSGAGESTPVVGSSRDVLGNPLNAVVWLIRHLALTETDLLPGEIVLTGGITSSLELPDGSIARASFVSDSWEGGVVATRSATKMNS